jgi:hypothetical protein
MSLTPARFFFCLCMLATTASCTRLNKDFRTTEEGPPPGQGDLGEVADLASARDAAILTGPGAVDLAMSSASPDLAPACVAGLDTHEPNDSCEQASSLGTLNELGVAVATGTVATAGDVDIFTVTLDENLHACADDQQSLTFKASVTLISPVDAALAVRGAIDPSSCNDNFSAWAAKSVCFTFSNECSDHESELATIEVGSASGQLSCLPYTLSIDFCGSGGVPCPGC